MCGINVDLRECPHNRKYEQLCLLFSVLYFKWTGRIFRHCMLI